MMFDRVFERDRTGSSKPISISCVGVPMLIERRIALVDGHGSGPAAARAWVRFEKRLQEKPGVP